MDSLLSDILVVEFAYRLKTYFAMIRTKTIECEKRHYVTILNGELEQLYCGHHIIIDKEAILNSPREILNGHLLELNLSVTDALDLLVLQDHERMN